MRLEFWLLLLFLALGAWLPLTRSVSVTEPPALATEPTLPAAPTEPTLSFRIQSAVYLFIIVVDGLRPDALQRAQTPNIDRLWQSGLYSWQAQTVSPSLTLPAVASLFTGLRPERHRVLWNSWMPERGQIAVPTVFDLAHEAQISTAAFVGKRKLQHLFQPQIPLQIIRGEAGHVLDSALEYISQHRPRLVFLHLSDVDDAGHRHGWMTLQQLRAVERVDQAVGRLMQKLSELEMLKGSVIILTSDHGGHGRIHGTDDPRDMTIPWILWTPEIETGQEIARTIYIYDTAATALAALGLTIPEEWEGLPLLEAFPEATLQSERP
ncbi:ectonucleotide pyrophosphatase/phosphodiesterase [Candidatus Acetothermia bacterium]|jgi:arylsulfatase A-like enzyme|nr:ectonucleotide pyrophosphatase/phosphodiesterase [Candidatus Acetothermia bacterium]MCI2432428.1 ectonucleotide pyrophosphatase/phosphodiesterase [Candidatus Acetothermia bacterium]MCI2436315.1 ectonucleotide pyrophosphatase/phosphodiesterase [Candidatus Acetothermia bacterium]